jgi:predicted nucleic acid-binding protein
VKREAKKNYVLDANAVLDLVDAGPGALRVKEIIHETFQERCVTMISVLNWGEVFYHVWQERGEEKARQTMGNLSRLPLDLVPVDLPEVLKAGEIKAVHKIPYVDCIAAALAETSGATLVTSDRDFEKLGRRIPILWIARP